MEIKIWVNWEDEMVVTNPKLYIQNRIETIYQNPANLREWVDEFYEDEPKYTLTDMFLMSPEVRENHHLSFEHWLEAQLEMEFEEDFHEIWLTSDNFLGEEI